MKKKKIIKFTLDINDLKNPNLNTLFGQAGLNFIKAISQIENIIKILQLRKGLINFLCFNDFDKKDFIIQYKNVNFFFLYKQFLYFYYIKFKKNLGKDKYKLNTNPTLVETTLYLTNSYSFQKNKILLNIKEFYIFYIFFLN